MDHNPSTWAPAAHMGDSDFLSLSSLWQQFMEWISKGKIFFFCLCHLAFQIINKSQAQHCGIEDCHFLRCWHSIRALISILAALLLMQLPTNVPRKATIDSLSVWDPVTHMRDFDGDPDFLANQSPAVELHMESEPVNGKIYLSLSLQLCPYGMSTLQAQHYTLGYGPSYLNIP